MTRPIVIVQGAQWGSEAKGAIAAYLCEKRGIEFAVRTGATNAGHTCYYKGVPVKLQQLPVGFVNPDAVLVLGAGALIDPVILDREVALLSDLTGTDIRKRLLIDYRAGLHLSVHADRSAESGRHVKMGATGKGCSEALIDRIKGRGAGAVLFGNSEYSNKYHTTDTEILLNDAIDGGSSVLLEGTQGQLLDLYLGPYPYVTHKQTGPAQWMLECGLSPALPTEIVSVVRTYPIRVAGNSGPMLYETSWAVLAESINNIRESKGLEPIVSRGALEAWKEVLHVAFNEIASEGHPVPEFCGPTVQHEWSDRPKYAYALSNLNSRAWSMLSSDDAAELSKLFELTTVTKKLRRVARLSPLVLRESARQMRPSWVALTFANYLWPEYWYETPIPENARRIEETLPFKSVGEASRAPVRLTTWGPGPDHIFDHAE